MSNNQETKNYSPLQQTMNWIGDKLLDAKNKIELDYSTQRLVNGMNVSENYKLIYEKLNNDTNNQWSIKLASATGALIQAYTAPTLSYAIDKLSNGLIGLYGESALAEGIDFFIGGNSNGSLKIAYARVGEIAGVSTASGFNKILSFIDSNESFKAKNNNEIFLSTPSDSDLSSTKSVEVVQNQNSIVITSNDYSQKQLIEPAKSLIKNQSSANKTKVTITSKDQGTVNYNLISKQTAKLIEDNYLDTNLKLKEIRLNSDSQNNSSQNNSDKGQILVEDEVLNLKITEQISRLLLNIYNDKIENY